MAMRLFGLVDGQVNNNDRPMFQICPFTLNYKTIATAQGWAKVFNDYLTELQTNTTLTVLAANWGTKHVFEGIVDPQLYNLGRNRGRVPFIEVDWRAPQGLTNTNESADCNMVLLVRVHHVDKNDHSNIDALLEMCRKVAAVIKQYSQNDTWQGNITVGEPIPGPISMYVDITADLSVVLTEGTLIA